jgi:hypothetical protein
LAFDQGTICPTDTGELSSAKDSGNRRGLVLIDLNVISFQFATQPQGQLDIRYEPKAAGKNIAWLGPRSRSVRQSYTANFVGALGPHRPNTTLTRNPENAQTQN